MSNIFSSQNPPFFMPDATYGIVNSVSWSDLQKIRTQAIVTNTLHNYLNYLNRTGRDMNLEELQELTNGGKYNFRKLTNWHGGILTDSGGFQAYSFAKRGLGKVTDEFFKFSSPIDKSIHKLTPEKSIEIQLALRPDVIVVLDDPLEPDSELDRIKLSVERTVRWAKICKSYFEKRVKEINDNFTVHHLNGGLSEYNPLIFCVIQGGGNFELRKYCFDKLAEIGFDGYGWGGWPLDKDGSFLDELADFNAELVNQLNDSICHCKECNDETICKCSKDKFYNYAMGVGAPNDIVKCLKYGYDLFDCVLPTRNARHGTIYTWTNNSPEHLNTNFDDYETVRINSAKYEHDDRIINPNSKIDELRTTSFKYLRQLFKIKDSNAFRIASLQNLEFYNELINKYK